MCLCVKKCLVVWARRIKLRVLAVERLQTRRRIWSGLCPRLNAKSDKAKFYLRFTFSLTKNSFTEVHFMYEYLSLLYF